MLAGAAGEWIRDSVITIELAPYRRGSRKAWRQPQSSCWGPALAARKQCGLSDRCFVGVGREGEKLVGQPGWHPGRRQYRRNGRGGHKAATVAPASSECRWHRWCCENQTAKERLNRTSLRRGVPSRRCGRTPRHISRPWSAAGVDVGKRRRCCDRRD